MLKILRNHRLFFILFFLWLIILACLLIAFSPTEMIFWVNQHNNPFLDTFFQLITLLGEDGLWLIPLVVFLYQYFKEKKDIKNKAIMLIIIWITKGIVSIGLKNLFNLPRPMEVYGHSGRAIHLVQGLEIHHWQSFPSGHTFTGFAFACFYLLVARNNALGFLWLFLGMLIGYSRVYLFQHFPRDVFAGSILGVAVVLGVVFMWRERDVHTT
ncbi:phosphatase PAP2 family protein [Emticicia sp. BO119]|uniref:phosphatase PAP2 family protein n=1 Tax=Emticicia sp. BO119 TaxID=2757768 RepID=UPI0015F10E1A|nr:phosphatase PAP2 family protein [Emticicia sp. BO119]MBA4850304.1 phosphatase PAP2 family protein [Emticicia sp. BO119]